MAGSEREPHWMDPIIEVYKKGLDLTLIRENLKLTPAQRIANLQSMLEGAERIRAAVQKSKPAEFTDQNDKL